MRNFRNKTNKGKERNKTQNLKQSEQKVVAREEVGGGEIDKRDQEYTYRDEYPLKTGRKKKETWFFHLHAREAADSGLGERAPPRLRSDLPFP